MSCGGAIVKILLILLNFVLLGGAVFIIYLGVQTMQLENESNMRDLIDTNLKTGSFALIGLGGIMGIICAIGFIGSCCESSCMLNFYGLLMLILLVGNVALFFTGYKYKDTVEKQISVGMNNGINRFTKDRAIAYALQKFQSTLKCCGLEGPSDFKKSDLPSSCCGQPFTYDQANLTCSKADIKYDVGCKNSPVIEQYLGQIVYSTVALVLIQVVIILSACCLARDIRSIPSDWD